MPSHHSARNKYTPRVCIFNSKMRFVSVARRVVKQRELLCGGKSLTTMSNDQERDELDRRASEGETVVPGGTGGKSVEAQEHLAEGRSKGGQTRKAEIGSKGYQEMGRKGGQTRKEQIGSEGYQEMGRKGGLSTADKSGGERAAKEGIEIDESKFRTKS